MTCLQIARDHFALFGEYASCTSVDEARSDQCFNCEILDNLKPRAYAFANGNEQQQMPSKVTGSQIAVRYCCDLIELLDFFQGGGKKFSLIRFALEPLSRRLSTLNKPLNLTTYETLMQ